VRRFLLVLTVALVMAVMALAVAMPAFAQAADPCETGTTPASPPDEGGSPAAPPPDLAPGTTVREPPPPESRGKTPFTGPTDRCDQSP
jgi:hypothetical protein